MSEVKDLLHVSQWRFGAPALFTGRLETEERLRRSPATWSCSTSFPPLEVLGKTFPQKALRETGSRMSGHTLATWGKRKRGGMGAQLPQARALQETQISPHNLSPIGLGLSIEFKMPSQKTEIPSRILLHTERSSNFFLRDPSPVHLLRGRYLLVSQNDRFSSRHTCWFSSNCVAEFLKDPIFHVLWSKVCSSSILKKVSWQYMR